MRSQHRIKAQKLMDGDGMDQDIDKAILTLVQGANEGDRGCFFDLAETYFDGVPEDDTDKAIHYLEAGANAGHGKCAAMLSELYQKGTIAFCDEDIVKRNAERSFEWAQKGAENSDPECLVKLGTYFKENGDKDKAEIFLKKCMSLEIDLIEDYSDKELKNWQNKAEAALN
ncbi:MAG: hypothetical protein VX642_06280 [Bdellovibrionota bacterium]|nr:hypothetical protein [Bdellovibrionota bacterium]